MKEYFVRLSEKELLMFVGFIKAEDNFISLLDKYSKHKVEMYKCYK